MEQEGPSIWRSTRTYWTSSRRATDQPVEQARQLNRVNQHEQRREGDDRGAAERTLDFAWPHRTGHQQYRGAGKCHDIRSDAVSDEHGDDDREYRQRHLLVETHASATMFGDAMPISSRSPDRADMPCA